MKVLIVSASGPSMRSPEHLLRYIFGATASSTERNLPKTEISNRRARFQAMLDEAMQRDDLGVGSIWIPKSSNGCRPSSIFLEKNAISLPTFATESKALASHGHPTLRRVMLHYVMAFPGESLTDERIVEAARFLLVSVGLQDHLAAYSVHRDTATLHLHCALSAVSITGKTCRAASNVRRFAFAARRAELQFGLQPGRGQQTVFGSDGLPRFSTKIERAEWRAEQSRERLRTKRERNEDRERNAAIERLKEREQERGLERGRDRGLER